MAKIVNEYGIYEAQPGFYQLTRNNGPLFCPEYDPKPVAIPKDSEAYKPDANGWVDNVYHPQVMCDSSCVFFHLAEKAKKWEFTCQKHKMVKLINESSISIKVKGVPPTPAE